MWSHTRVVLSGARRSIPVNRALSSHLGTRSRPVYRTGTGPVQLHSVFVSEARLGLRKEKKKLIDAFISLYGSLIWSDISGHLLNFLYFMAFVGYKWEPCIGMFLLPLFLSQVVLLIC